MVVRRVNLGRGDLTIGFLYLTTYKTENKISTLSRISNEIAREISVLRDIEPLERILSHMDIFPITFQDKNYYERNQQLDKKTKTQYDISGTNGMGVSKANIEDRSFVVNEIDALIFAHEIGHLLGLKHPEGLCHTRCYGIGKRIPKTNGGQGCIYKNDVMSWCRDSLSPNEIRARNSIIRFSEQDREFLLQSYSSQLV